MFRFPARRCGRGRGGSSNRQRVCDDVDLETYELLDRAQRLRTRVKMQAAIIALLMRILTIRGGKLSMSRLPDGRDKSSLLRTLAPASKELGVDSALTDSGSLSLSIPRVASQGRWLWPE